MRIVTILTATVVSAGMLAGTPTQAAVPVMKKPGPSLRTTVKEGRKAMREGLRATGSTSGSIALVSNGKVVWSQTFGRVTPGGKRPSRTTLYGVGSVSKVVTTMAVMQLVDQGKVSLDAPVSRYIPEFAMQSPQYKQITVRMLLSHSAGVPGTNFADLWSSVPIPSYVDGVLTGLRNSRLKTTPGAMNVYCNDCFTLAGVVVERVSGMAFQDYVTANILKPLGMKRSRYPTSVPPAGKVAPIIADGKALPIEITNAFATGGLMSTPEEMTRLATVFTNEGTVGGKRILSPSAIQQMAVDETATSLRVGPPSFLRYGLGWDSVEDPALKSAGVLGWTKGGDTVDYHASFAIAPDQELGVVVLGAGRGFSSIAAETVAQTVLLNALAEMGAIASMPKQVSGNPGKGQVTPKMAKAKIQQLSGTFLAQNETKKLIQANPRSVRVATLVDGAWVRSPGRFELRNDGAFWSTTAPGTSIRAVRAWGRTYVVQRSLGGVGTYYSSVARGQKVRSAGALAPAWQQRVGKKWLLANESPDSLNWSAAAPVVEIRSIPGLSGYLLATGALVDTVPFDATSSENTGTMFLQIPLGFGRDLLDFDFTMGGGEEFLSFDSSVLRPAATVPSLSVGTNQVAIGPEGLVQWYQVPEAATLTLTGHSDWKMFDSGFSLIGAGQDAPATEVVAAGSYLAVFGSPLSTATVVVE